MMAWPHPMTYDAMSMSGDNKMRAVLMNRATGFHAILAGQVAMAKTPEAYDSDAMS